MIPTIKRIRPGSIPELNELLMKNKLAPLRPSGIQE